MRGGQERQGCRKPLTDWDVRRKLTPDNDYDDNGNGSAFQIPKSGKESSARPTR
jgi:hypothetical protein